MLSRPGDRAGEGISRNEAPLTGQTEHEIAQLHARDILWALFDDKQEEEEVHKFWHEGRAHLNSYGPGKTRQTQKRIEEEKGRR